MSKVQNINNSNYSGIYANSVEATSASGDTAAGNVIVGTSNCITYPYTYPYTPYITYVSSTADIQWTIKLREVENGYILQKDGKEFVITDVKQILDILKKK